MTTEMLSLLTHLLEGSIGTAVLTAVLVFLTVGAVKLLLRSIWRAITGVPDRVERWMMRRSSML